MSNYDGLDEVFDVEPVEIEKSPPSKPPAPRASDKPEIQHDYETSRAQLHSLVMKGQEAIDGILEVARSSDHPRAYEVAGQLIKNTADVADKLIDLQKKMKDLDEQPKSGPTTVNNTMFVGSTAELQKLLKQNTKGNK
ncbi:terminase small subunit [Synechococcus phage S-H38]|mgnify:CR=1 FL=1|uniref:Terminase small subunit n=1 Tax=Synechococcus phage S-H38 TaxID=2783673 RepID=A0A873WF58_9CAUD|nr:terminase small subunit [Synechococcus phage S-H38]QPB07976.1 terminase small subunit [Synechococcus phage S-H38]